GGGGEKKEADGKPRKNPSGFGSARWIRSSRDADSGAVEHKSARPALRRANEHSRRQSPGRGGIIEDGGRPCPGGKRRTRRQILAAAKRHCPSRTARVTEPSQLNICRSLSVFDQP